MKKLPENWNKQFQFVKIRLIPRNFIERLFPKETYVGYCFPTNNWVEVHCFESKKEMYQHTFDSYCDFYYDIEVAEGVRTQVARPMKKCYRSKNKIFRNRIKSFIIPRRMVFFSSPNIIYCNPMKKDFKRWKQWHPNDDYIKCFEGEDKDGYYEH